MATLAPTDLSSKTGERITWCYRSKECSDQERQTNEPGCGLLPALERDVVDLERVGRGAIRRGRLARKLDDDLVAVHAVRARVRRIAALRRAEVEARDVAAGRLRQAARAVDAAIRGEQIRLRADHPCATADGAERIWLELLLGREVEARDSALPRYSGRGAALSRGWRLRQGLCRGRRRARRGSHDPNRAQETAELVRVTLQRARVLHADVDDRDRLRREDRRADVLTRRAAEVLFRELHEQRLRRTGYRERLQRGSLQNGALLLPAVDPIPEQRRVERLSHVAAELPKRVHADGGIAVQRAVEPGTGP